MKNLSWKLIVIAAVLLLFVAGIVGRPQEFSKDGLLASP